MRILINNNERVFQIITSTGKQYFCNLRHISKIVLDEGLIEGYYTIYHFWNNRPKKVSRKYLIELLGANGYEYNFYY